MIEMVIKIPEEIYSYLLSRYKYQNIDDTGLSGFDKVGVAIKSGTPLPKGQEPCEDCISRKDTIDWLKQVTVTDGITFETGFKQILHDIEQMPSVKQEPKTDGDCISREAVLRELDKYLCGVPFNEKGIDEVIKELPPVTPSRPKGKWINNNNDDAGEGYFICSKCKSDVWDVTDYCPNCGSKME